MKLIQTTGVALLGLSFLSAAHAATTSIYIAGSNGDRVITQTAIGKLLTGGKFQGLNADPTKANFGIWTGKFNGDSVKIKVAFIGATGGIAAVAGQQKVKFSADSAPTVDPTLAGNASDQKIPNFTLSTNFQSSSIYNGTVNGISYEKLKDQIVGVVGLKWLGSKGYPGNNFTTAQGQQLFKLGKLPLALFTGKKADRNKTVFATGRNSDAGQRYGALTELGLGFAAVTKHYKPTITGQTANPSGVLVGGTVTSQALWPIETYSGVSSRTLGNSGAASGATLAPYLTAVLGPNAYKIGNEKATAGWYISYLTFADAKNIAIPGGAVELKWNGIAYSDAAIREGSYTFWLYTHVLYRNALSGLPRTFADTLATQIKTVDATAQNAGLFVSTLGVKRSSDGAPVLPRYF